ncbi:purine-nucleoside phosphorylase, partial [Escherichia coli]
MGTIAEAAAAALSAMTGSSSPSVAIVLGSGWTDAADV